MYVNRTIKHVRQDRADVNAAVATLKAESWPLAMNTKRTPEQDAQLIAVDAKIATMLAKAAEIETELATFERLADVERGQGSHQAGDLLVPTGRKWAQMFGAQSLDVAGFKDRNEFLAILHQGLSDPRMVFQPGGGMQAIATGNIPSDGGFSVPTQYVAEWMDSSLENEIVRPLATVWPMTAPSRKVPGVDGSNHTSTLFGGFAGGWYNEGEELDLENIKLRMITIAARKLGILSEVSNELLSDGLSYNAQLSKAIVAAIGWYLDYGFLNGNGASAPLGAINAACTITITKELNQPAATINYDNLLKMFARMPAHLMKEAVWVANSSCIPQLGKLSIAIGTGGSHIPVMTESAGEFKILTRPVKFTEKVPTLGTKGDIGFYAFSQYAVGLRQEMSLDKSSHVGFTRDTSHYRGILRGDGMPMWDQAMTPKNGTAMSPFVVLETRA